MRAVIRIINRDGQAEEYPTPAVTKAALAEQVALWRGVYARAEGRVVYGYAAYVSR